MPDTAAEVRWGEDGIAVFAAGERMGGVPFDTLRGDPVDAVEATLKGLLEEQLAVWARLPDDTPWYMARKVVGSARAAGREDLWLSDHSGHSVQLVPQEPIALKMRCSDGPKAWTGVQPRVTVAIQRNDEAVWMRGTARFLPLVDGRPTDGLPAECLAASSCEAMFTDEADRSACRDGQASGAPTRVELGSEVGCMLPLIQQTGDLARWQEMLPGVLRGLGLGGGLPLVVAPEAAIRWDVVMSTLAAFPEADLPVPALGQPLIEGNDGPPICTADVRDAAALRRAGARVVGSWLAIQGRTE